MAFATKILTSIRGRRLGIQRLSTAESGSGRGPHEFLAGTVEGIRRDISTAETTSSNLRPFGASILTTAVSSGVYTLDPPIPGLQKSLVFHTTGANPIYVKTANAETIVTTQGTSNTTLVSSQTNAAAVILEAISTAIWYAVGSISSGFLRASTTT